jgi:predicted MPP superfamily phosphohydrolase
LTISEADIAVSGLDPAFDGLRILLVTDVHTGPFVSPRGWSELIPRLLSLELDLLLIGGDTTTSRVSDFSTSAKEFSRLHAPLGVFGVLGNHDHFTGDAPRLTEELEAAGIDMLQNRSVLLERGSARLAVAGIDDLLFGAPDLELALRDVPRGVPIVLLSHNPDVLYDAAARGVAVVLAGHTHAGQIRVPGLPVLVRMSRYRLDEGRYRCGETELVVSAGLGAAALPIRIFCPPEVVLLRLRSSPPHDV